MMVCGSQLIVAKDRYFTKANHQPLTICKANDRRTKKILADNSQISDRKENRPTKSCHLTKSADFFWQSTFKIFKICQQVSVESWVNWRVCNEINWFERTFALYMTCRRLITRTKLEADRAGYCCWTWKIWKVKLMVISCSTTCSVQWLNRVQSMQEL